MRPLIVACLVAVATARPERYSYPSSSRTNIHYTGSNGFTPGSSGFISENNGFTHGSSGFISENNGFTPGSSGFVSENTGFTPGSSGFVSENTGFTPGSSGFVSENNGFTFGSNDFISGVHHASNFDSSTSSQVPLIHNHIYVHVASPEHEVPQRQVIPQLAARQNPYNIVFSKTPVISAQAHNEENTLIHVFVKRPEDAPQISLLTVTPRRPSKPEAYFIKYDTQEDTFPQPSLGCGGEGGIKYPNQHGPTTLGKESRPDSNAK